VFALFDRYIYKEIIPPFFIGLVVYTFVLLMNQILLFTEMFISRGVSFGNALELFIYLIPSVLAFTVPMSILMGILAGLSRMSSDAEITAFRTLGISNQRFLVPILFFSFAGFLLTSFLSLYLAPQANYKWVQTFSRSVVNKMSRIKPREFNESIPETVIFVQDIARDKSWEKIFVYLSNSGDEPRAVFAESGRLNFYPEEKRAILELSNGASHSYSLSNPEKYKITAFKHFEEELNVKSILSSDSIKKGEREKDIRELFQGLKILRSKLEKIPPEKQNSPAIAQLKRNHISHLIEIHKKFALPLACLIFALLGMSLGASTRKGGRTSGFTLSIVIILIYYILITAGEQLAMEQRITPWFGMWGPNIIFICLGIYFLIRSLKEFSVSLVIYRFWKTKIEARFRPRKKPVFRSVPRFSLPFPNILDRYIIRKFSFIFFLVFLSLLSIFIIVTFFEQIDKVYENNKPLSLFFEFLWYKIPEFVHYILPVAALTAAFLSLGIMSKFNEITAMKAGGISIYRIIVPVLILGLFLSIGSFYVQEKILPYSNKKADELLSKITNTPPRTYGHIDRQWIMSKDRNRIYHYKYFDTFSSVFSQLSIFDLNPSSWSLIRRIFAEKASLKQNMLSMSNCWSREFIKREPVEFERFESMSLFIGETKNHFVREWKAPDQMNYQELKQYIDDIEERNFDTTRFKVDLNYKLSFPLACLIMTLLAIPFAFSMGKKGTLVGIGLSVIIAIVYWGMIGIFKNLGYVNYLNAFFASWGPNLIFGMIGMFLLFTRRT